MDEEKVKSLVLPVQSELTISDVEEAVRYWLQERVFQSNVRIASIGYSGVKNVFTVKFDRG
jgi:hypothetical protein